ncbi:hypothetical protein DKY63_04400 [Pseudomonas putida]|uniref:Uncharacterized protein n=1 Tax=Pseudomonas putida TaxID=303 RepID=A0A2Z4REG0_PSEPU|nr:phasin family protein [Pseudomonas putida]AWY39185.1 hypothetical protein DKY63_04400 [Pseudomonas putida]
MGKFDPFQLWGEALNVIEREINSLATKKMESAEFAQALHQFSRVSLGVQHVFERSVANVLRRLELPSRSEVDTLASAVQRIEDKLDQLLPPPASAALAPRPSRTLRPSPAQSKSVKRVLKPATKRAPKED